MVAEIPLPDTTPIPAPRCDVKKELQDSDPELQDSDPELQDSAGRHNVIPPPSSLNHRPAGQAQRLRCL